MKGVIEMDDKETQKYEANIAEPYDNADVPPENTAVPTQVSELSNENRSPSKQTLNKNKTFDEYCRESVILGFIISICTYISKVSRKSLTASVFTSYQSTAEAFGAASLSGNKLFRILSKIVFRFKRFIQEQLSTAAIPKTFNRFTSALLSFKTGAYGLVLLFFSLGTALIYVIKRFYINIGTLDIYAPISATVILIIALMLLFNKNTLVETLRESLIGSFIFFSLLGIDQTSDTSELSPSGSGACIIGTLLSLLTIFIPAHTIGIFILVAIYTVIMLKSPETSFISLILIIPFVSQIYAVYICSLTIISYTVKLMCGKRSLKFEFMDIFVFAFLLIAYFGSTFTFGSNEKAYVMLLYTAIYFIAVNIMKSEIWFKRTVTTIILSAVFLTIYSAFISVFKNILDLPIDFTPQTDIGNSDVTIFASVSLLGIVIIYSIFFIISELLLSNTNTRKITLFFIAAFALFFVFSSLSPTAKIATFVSIILFFMLYSKKTAAIFTLITVMLPFVPLFLTLPSAQIFDFFKTEIYRTDVWKSVAYLLLGNALPESAEMSIPFFTGIGFTGAGTGDGAFSDIFSITYPGSSNGITHTHSLFLQLFVSFGGIGIIVFLLIIFFIIQNCFSFGRCCIDKKLPSRIYNYAGMCSVVALSLCGLGEYIWYNPRVILIFWIICAISVSAKRSAYISDVNYLQLGKYTDNCELL